MAFRFDSNHQFAQELTLSIGAVGASAVASQVFAVKGVTPDYAYKAHAPVAFSDGLHIIEAKCMSADNLRITFFNTTGSGITQASTAGMRIVSD